MKARLQKEVARRGIDAREYANKLFLRLFVSAGEPAVTESERVADWERLLSFAGNVRSGDPNSGDNKKIDEDLACENRCG